MVLLTKTCVDKLYRWWGRAELPTYPSLNGCPCKPARKRKIHSKIFNPLSVNSAALSRIWSKFKIIHTLMAALINCKNDEDPIKMKTLERSQLYILLFRRLRVVGDEIWQKFKLTQAFMVVLVTCKNDEDPSKNECTRVLTTFLPLEAYGIFPDIQGQLTLQTLVQSCRISNPSKIL